jgi:hypothetical protein
MFGKSLSVLLEGPWYLRRVTKANPHRNPTIGPLRILILSLTIVGIPAWLLCKNAACISKSNITPVLVASKDADHPELGVFKVNGTVKQARRPYSLIIILFSSQTWGYLDLFPKFKHNLGLNTPSGDIRKDLEPR